MPRYSKEFFRSLKEGSRLSAEQVVPLVIGIVGPVASVVDVGCGTGEWLKVFQQHGVGKILGLDGEYPEDSAVEPNNFLAADLTKPLPVDSNGFELIVSLEVAEHLPPESAEAFIAEIGRLGPVVLFSAAVPFQGGTHHVNEQWQSYWCAIFKKQGFECFDALRPLIWQTEGIDWWYRQNIMLFVRHGRQQKFPKLTGKEMATPDLIHPENYLSRLALRPVNLLDRLRNVARKILAKVLRSREGS